MTVDARTYDVVYRSDKHKNNPGNKRAEQRA